MKTFLRTASICAAACLAVALACHPLLAAEATKAKGPALQEKGPTCPDLAGKLSLTKALAGDTATITLNGKACNGGTADYVTPPGPAATGAFYVYTWHPPKTPAQEHDMKEIGRHKLKSLKKGECVSFTQTFTMPGVARWGQVLTASGERQAMRQFVFRVEKSPAGSSFSKSEDCSDTNNSESQDIAYVEKAAAVKPTPGTLEAPPPPPPPKSPRVPSPGAPLL
jgi:hypothetical protein